MIFHFPLSLSLFQKPLTLLHNLCVHITREEIALQHAHVTRMFSVHCARLHS